MSVTTTTHPSVTTVTCATTTNVVLDNKSDAYRSKHAQIMATNRYSCGCLFALAYFFGCCAAHRCYVAEVDGWCLPMIELFTFGGCGIWYMIDYFAICCCHWTEAKNDKWRRIQLQKLDKEDASLNAAVV